MVNQKKRPTIGVLVSGIMDEFTRSVSKGIILTAGEMDVNVVVLPGKYLDRDLSENRDLMYEYQYNTIFSYAKKENVDAIIVIAGSIGCYTTKERMLEMLEQYAGIPCVLVASKLEGYVDVAFDNYAGIREGLYYLVEKLKCRKIGMLGGPLDNSDAFERKEAFTRILLENGLPAENIAYVEGDFSRRCEKFADQLLDENPDLDAVFCVNDETALGMYEFLKKRNLYPGKNISIFGYDDTIGAAKAYPPLSSVKADPAELGEYALKMVLQMYHGERVESKVLSTRFVMRDSFCRPVEEESQAISDTQGIYNWEHYFEDVFYRYKHEEIWAELEKIKGTFYSLMDKLEQHFVRHERSKSIFEDIQLLLDTLLNNGAIEYADMDNLLIGLEKRYYLLEKLQKDNESKMELKDVFSVMYRKIIRAMDYRFGVMRDADDKENYAMKLFIRDMLQFEKGNDQSYAFLLGNLDWLNVKNAYLYVFAKPIMHLYKEEFVLPKQMYLKAVLKNGEVSSVPVMKQKQSMDEIYDNGYISKDRRYTMVLSPLFTNEMLYGVLLCDLTEKLYENGEFLINQMSSAAKMIDLLKSNEKIQQQLEESLATLHENNIALDTLSRYDVLTGILNRRGFSDGAQNLITKSRENGDSLLVIYVDMNNLKIINDRYGHEEGDFSLKLIGELLVEITGQRGIGGRIGGDEFACVLKYEKEDGGKQFLDEIYNAFQEYNEESSKPYNITISAGAYVLKSTDFLSLSEALDQADEKLYEVKRHRTKEVAK